MDFKDYYSILGVAKTATEKEIKQAYRKLARKHHPDVNPGDKSAEARFKEINEAYEVLGDPPKRKKYDELGSNWSRFEQAGGAQGFDPSQFGGGEWNVNYGTGAQGGFHTVTADDMREMFGDANPFSDFFQTFFGGATGGSAGSADEGGRRGRASRSGRGARAGRDLEQQIELSLEDAYHGITRRLAIKHGGHSRTVDVRFPAGVNDGARVRVAGEGEQGTGGQPAGDLFLRIRLVPHPRFERKGRDLYTHVAVPLTTAMLGGDVEVTTLSGKSLRLKIPATTQSGQVFRLKGHGMPTTGNPDEVGDLYATIDVQLPRELTPEQRRLFEELQKLEKGTKDSAA